MREGPTSPTYAANVGPLTSLAIIDKGRSAPSQRERGCADLWVAHEYLSKVAP